MNKLTATVIIPTYRPDGRFPKLLSRLRRQTSPPEEILIVNTGEEYFDPAWVSGQEHVRVVHIKKEAFDHGGTRDMAAGQAHTDLLIFMTMDALPADRYLLERLKECFDDAGTACAYARQLPAGDASPLERYARQYNYGPDSVTKSSGDLERLGIKTFFCSNVCAAYRADVYRRMGGFEKHVIFNEDMIFAGRAVLAGYRVRYCAEAKVIHSHRYTGAQQLKRNFDLGVSQQQYPEIFGIVSSESEGVKMIREEIGWLIGKGYGLLIPQLIWQSGCKYLGYRLGKSWKKLPGPLIRRLTMNPGYWDHRK